MNADQYTALQHAFSVSLGSASGGGGQEGQSVSHCVYLIRVSGAAEAESKLL